MRFLILILLAGSFCQADELYFDIGIGYKLEEAKIYGYNNTSPTAHFALGYEWNTIRLELSHDSNYLSGPPFNHDWEYYRTELRVVKRFDLWGMYIP